VIDHIGVGGGLFVASREPAAAFVFIVLFFVDLIHLIHSPQAITVLLLAPTLYNTVCICKKIGALHIRVIPALQLV